MYDRIFIDVDKLPISDEEKLKIENFDPDWQTKDLDNLLDNYIIEDSGELFRERDYIRDKINFHGVIGFHSNVGKWSENYDWYEFKAKFTDGKLIEITGGKRD